ncbi:hypothetical protein TIFTF001_052615, partial [Ficus carica]
MAIAAAISAPMSSPSPAARRSFSSFSPLRQPSFLRARTSGSTSPSSCLYVSASSSSSSMTLGAAAEKASTVAFLDRRETGFLHFVKYHGLGNDFIL